MWVVHGGTSFCSRQFTHETGPQNPVVGRGGVSKRAQGTSEKRDQNVIFYMILSRRLNLFSLFSATADLVGFRLV